jgi:hypothetical protein
LNYLFQSNQKILIPSGYYKSLKVIIQFSKQLKFIRNFKYQWQSLDKTCICGPLSPKILKFSDGSYLMANRYIGTWLYDPEEPTQIEWIIFGKDVQPYFRYDKKHKREWLEVGGRLHEDLELQLIETENPIELSFSKLSFKPVIIFTDHCDFDSDVLLKKQREFFKSKNIKVTKGFFLKKYSNKGEWNSALEGNESEYLNWINDGHELANHSLSQSILPGSSKNNELFEEFNNPNFESSIKVWIDHGYQTYNISKSTDYQQRAVRLNLLKQKGINLIWNYYDVAEVVDSLNQLDYDQMSLSRIFCAKKLSFIEKTRISIFHLSTEENLLLYRRLTSTIKQMNVQRFLIVVSNVTKLLFCIIRKRPNFAKLKRSQCIFNSGITDIHGFQTIVVKDWLHALGMPLGVLKSESGLSIVHSYFSFLGKHHNNPLFMDERGSISMEVNEVFDSLGKDIEAGEIWNPTVSEFMEYLNHLYTIDLRETQDLVNMRYV